MADSQEKDNFWLWIGGLIVTTIILVFILKGRETEHLASGAAAEIGAVQDAEIAAQRKTKNTAVNEN